MKNCLKYFSLALCLHLCLLVKGQSIVSIKGNVINAKNEVMLGNALLLSLQDSTILKGTSFFEGKFELIDINEQKVLLKLTSLEFQDYYSVIEYQGKSEIDLGNIVTNEAVTTLDEVVLVSNIPPIQTKSDGSVQVNVENTVLATSTSVEEILSRSPNVIVEDDGIAIFGKGSAIIYLNGQRILNEQLANIQPSEIKRIDIITNPSAKYDAEGEAVIHIVTIKKALEGVKGLLQQNITVSDFASPLSNTNLSLDYRKKKMSIRGNYGVEMGPSRFILNTTRTRSAEGDFFNSDITTDWEWKQKYFANYGLGVQHNFNEGSYLSIAYNGLTNDLGGTETSNNTIIANSEMEDFQSIVNKDDLTSQHALALNLSKVLDTLGSSLYIGGQYSLNKTTINDLIDEIATAENQTRGRTLKNLVKRSIPILSAQGDYTKVFADQSQIEMGLKLSTVSNTSSSQFLTATDNREFIFDTNLSRDFEYNENIYGAYMNYSKAVENKFNYAVGLRTEYTTYNLSSDAENSGLLEKNYTNLFPNFSFNTSIDDDKSLFASYSSRIFRPRYQSLNPTIVYQDAFTSIQGNPNIVPEKIHAFELGVNLKKLTVKLGYTHTIDPITGGAVQGENPKSYILQRLNSDAEHHIFASLSAPLNTNWWTSTNTFTVSYRKIVDTRSSFGFNVTRPQAYLYTNNKFSISQGFKIQLLAWYLSDRYDGIYFRKNQADVTIGIEKEFLKKSLKLQIVANDIFHTNKPDGNYRLGDTRIFFDRVYNTQNFRFVATYNFGKLKKSNYQRKSSGDDENNRL
ncbi:MAG: outer membrane beta-barrel family protein [Maribacter sp.]|uniref:outer membrane beta-barrel family protein n=1 Tax=Maribacter sp. TaxID=1897614 RepID=UPI003297787D